MSVLEAVAQAVRGEELPAALLESAFAEITAGEAGPVPIAALLVALRTKGESVEEIVGAARALRAAAVTAPCPDPRTVDLCGTGGDGASTFNISTTAAFVVAGAGVPVAKHGNRAASSRSGSIDVLEALGVGVDLSVEESAQVLRQVGMAPFFARRAHPAMRHVAPVRQELGIRTVMNCMGPLLNPVGVRFQLVGVYGAELVTPLAEALGRLDAERALVVHGDDGLDEVSLCAPTRAALLAEGSVRSFEIDPREHGLDLVEAEALRGGDPAENAAITRAVLDGEAGPRRQVSCLNAAAALWAAGAVAGLDEGLARAEESVDSGRARGVLEELVRATAGGRAS